jgi:hypothetical protein
LNKKLEQLAEREPPKNRKTAVDLLEPLRDKLLALHRNGWSSLQLVDELKSAGVPVSPARLRECFNRWTHGGRKTIKRRGVKLIAAPTPPPAMNQSGRNKSSAGDGQSKIGLAQ